MACTNALRSADTPDAVALVAVALEADEPGAAVATGDDGGADARRATSGTGGAADGVRTLIGGGAGR